MTLFPFLINQIFWEKINLVAVKFKFSFGNSVSPTCACMMSHVAMLYHNLARAWTKMPSILGRSNPFYLRPFKWLLKKCQSRLKAGTLQKPLFSSCDMSMCKNESKFQNSAFLSVNNQIWMLYVMT